LHRRPNPIAPEDMSSFYLSDSAPITPQLWAVIAMGVLTVLYAVFLRPMRQRKDPLARAGEQRGMLARQRAVEKQMETLLVELSGMARQITAQLDTRAAKLEALIHEADEKIAALQASPAPRPEAPGIAGAEPAQLDDPRHMPVYVLADAGMNAPQIAQRLSRPVGEVELILALRPKRNDN
jgi:hypothetical protein